MTTVSIEPWSVTALVGSSPVVFTCTITLNHDIGADHSALNVVWKQDAMSVTSSTTPAELEMHNMFLSSVTISTHTSFSEKEYCCNTSIIGTKAVSVCSSVEVLGENSHVLLTLCE